MRSSSALLLLLVAAVAGFLAYSMWLTPTSDPVLEGPIAVEDQTTQGGELPAGVEDESTGQSDRTAVEGVQPEVPAAVTGLTEEELATLDSNALLGLVIDAEGNGIPGCEVTFIEGGLRGVHAVFGGQMEIEGAPIQLTDERGGFQFLNLEPGDQHALRVSHPEISMLIVEGVVVGDFGPTAEPPILLLHGKRVRGVVTNELDIPVAGADVHLDGQWRPADPRASHDRLSAVTDSEGKYQILGVQDGTRCLTVVADDLGQLTRIQSLTFSDATGQAHIVNMKLLGAAACAGRVTDQAGNGIAGIDVLAVDRKAYRDVNNNRTISGPDGSFVLPNLARGTYEFTASAPGFASVRMNDVQVPQEGISIVMGTQRLIHGAVVAASDGEGVPAFELQLLSHQGGVGSVAIPRGAAIPVQSTGGGKFTIPLTERPGLWSIQASAPGFAVSVSDPFVIAAEGDVTDVIVAMNLGGTIRGQLQDDAGEPVPGGRVTSRDDAWTDDAFSQLVGAEEGHTATVLEVRSGHDGTFVLPNLRAGKYQLITRSAKLHQQAHRNLTVEEGATLDVGVLTLTPGGGLHGTLFDSQATPVRTGSVFLNPVGGGTGAPVRRCKSDFEGRWEIKNIVPGEYRLSGKPPSAVDASALGFWPSGDGEVVLITGGVKDLRDIHLSDWTVPAPPEPEPPTGQLSGKLTNAAGTALVGNQVRLTPVSTGASPAVDTKTAREGTFTFLKLLPGDYDLSVPGQPDSLRRVTIRIDAWTHQDLVSAE